MDTGDRDLHTAVVASVTAGVAAAAGERGVHGDAGPHGRAVPFGTYCRHLARELMARKARIIRKGMLALEALGV